MEDYKANSHRSKEENNLPSERKKVEPVVKGTVKKKKNNARVLANTFISEDIQKVKSYVLMDVLIPAVKKAISDIVTNGIEMILYGETRDRRNSSSAHTVSYRSYYEDRDRRDDRRSESRIRAGYSYDDLVFDNRMEAEDVLNRMEEIIDQYKIVSVADMYDLANVSCCHTDYNYGWSDIRSAEVISVRDGYIIKMPKALPIK